jgi:hypothetical protein
MSGALLELHPYLRERGTREKPLYFTMAGAGAGVGLMYLAVGCAVAASHSIPERSAVSKAAPMSKNELWVRAQNLFALAVQARERGDSELAQQLEARAIQPLEGVNGITDSSQPPAVPQQQQQQQQQIKEDGEKE